MDATAIARIEQLAASTHIDIPMILAHAEGGSIPATTLPQGVSVQSLERYLPAPSRLRGHFTTNLRAAFLDYCRDYAAEGSRIDVNPHNMCARAVFDFGDNDNPQWGTHTADLTLEQTPAYAALLANFAVHKSQLDTVDFAEDWRTHITFTAENGDVIDFRQALNAIRKIDIKAARDLGTEAGDFAHKRSALEQVEITSGHQLPAGFIFSFAPYTGFEQRDAYCRLRAHTTGDKPTLSYRILALEELQEQIADEFRLALESAPETGNAPVYIGAFQHQT